MQYRKTKPSLPRMKPYPGYIDARAFQTNNYNKTGSTLKLVHRYSLESDGYFYGNSKLPLSGRQDHRFWYYIGFCILGELGACVGMQVKGKVRHDIA